MSHLPIVSAELIAKCIPQREPIVMVHTLEDHRTNYVKSTFTISSSNIFVESNRLQESGLIEHMAQSVALYTGYRYYINNEVAPTGYIGSIDRLNIIRCPRVEETVTTEVNIMHEFNDVTMVRIQSYVDEVMIGESQMKTVTIHVS